MTQRSFDRWMVAVLWCLLLLTTTDGYAQARKGYALWCYDNKTMYFVQADNAPSTYKGQDVYEAWEINDENTCNGAAAPAWIRESLIRGLSIYTVTKNLTTVVIDKNFRFVAPSGFYSWFHDCEKLTSVQGLSYLNTSRAGYMNKMFYGCKNLESIDFVGVDMSPIVSTTMMFYGCEKLRTIYADETWQQKYSSYMFTGCEQLQGDVAFDAGRVGGDMATTYGGYLTEAGNVYALFIDGVGPDDDYLYFVNTSQTLNEGDAYEGKIVDRVFPLSEFKTYQGYWAWWGNTLLRHVIIEPAFRTVALPTLERFFYDTPITDIDGVEYLNTTQATSMRDMFNNCTGLTSLDLRTLDMSNIRDFGYMFHGCINLSTLKLAGVNTSQATDMEYMFDGCRNLPSIDLSVLNTENVTRMRGMFKECASFTTLDLSPLKTSKVTDMESIFNGCTGLTELDVNPLDMDDVENVKDMFNGCSSLNTIYCEKTWDVAVSDNMFLGCTQLSSHINYDADKVDCVWANPVSGYFYSELTPPIYDPQGRFIIRSVADWEEFASRVNNGETELSAVMKTDLEIDDSNTKVGTEDNQYAGAFDGAGHSLTVNFTATDVYCAPFTEVKGGCTIQNIHVKGTVNAGGYRYAAGVIGYVDGPKTDVINLSKCWSSVTINSTYSGAGKHGGLIGGAGVANINITNCLFDGAIIGENTYGCGGFVGYTYWYNHSNTATGRITIANSLMNATIGFNTNKVAWEASGPLYAMYSSSYGPPYSSSDYMSSDKVTVNSSGYTTEFGYTNSSSTYGYHPQGVNFSGYTLNNILGILGSSNWMVQDGNPVIVF